MKYALFFFAFLFDATTSQARTITSFKNSEALLTVAQFMSDVRDDLPTSVLLTDKKIVIKDTSLCTSVSSDDVFQTAVIGIKKVLRFYPDDELPVEQALIDLEDYLDQKNFKKCLFEKTTKDHIIKTAYFLDAADKIHLRMDIRTLLVDRQ